MSRREVSDESELSRQDGSCTYSFWNPFSLTFSTRSKELRYVYQNIDAWLTQDVVAHILGTLPGPFYVYNLHSVLPKWYAILWLALSLVYAPVNVYISLLHRQEYSQVRLMSVAFIRLIIPFCFIGFGFYDVVPAPKFNSIIMSIFTKSAAVNMLFSCLNFRVLFVHHVIIHTIAYFISLLWIPGFCQKCATDPAVMNRFQQMGYSIDSLFSLIISNRVQDVSVYYPCWMLTTMIITLSGYVIPTLLVFMTEVLSRSVFLQTRITEEYQPHLRNFKDTALRVGIIASIAASVATWLIMTLMRDTFQGS